MRRAALSLGALGLVACSQPLPEACEGVTVAIADGSGVRPGAFQITLAPDSGEVVAGYCEGNLTTNPALTCNDDGVYLPGSIDALGMVIKVKGCHTLRQQQSVTYDQSDSTCPGGGRLARIPLTLAALPSFESNADYVTGFSEETGHADFAALAVEVPGELGISEVVKFFIADIRGEPDVYFQNTREHPLHYGFVRTVLGLPLSLGDYEMQTYHGEGRTQMAGSIVYYPSLDVISPTWGGSHSSPVTVEFFPSDDLSPELALLAYGLLEERLLFAPLVGSAQRLFYVPAGDTQDDALFSQRARFAAESALWLHPEEIYADVRVQYLNPGVACGTLQRLSPESLATTPVSYRDVLILSRLPNYLPVVGGTISEELQTPLAHVNVAARNRGTPNLALLDAASDPRVAPLIGELVRFEVGAGTFTLTAISLAEAEAFWDTLIPAEPFVPASDLSTTGFLPFANIGFADAETVGVKAANVAELTHVIGETAPDGFAVPFAHYESFMSSSSISTTGCTAAEADCLSEGRTNATCEAVASFCAVSGAAGTTLNDYRDLLLDDGTFQADSVFREAALDGLRHLIHHIPVEATFGADLDAEVAARFGDRRARLRSSTNAEDLEQFSGAGLYRSVSADALADDPASSRIRKVWASVWNWSAFEERSFWNIDHRAVKMGVAVHRSFPDELANGVLITQNIADCGVSGFYVNVQLGETSVTNPEGGALPEIFSLVAGAAGMEVIRQRFSSLSPGFPIMTPEETGALQAAATSVQSHFSVLYGASPFELALELEFKLENPDRNLVVKQVRPYYVRGGGACN